MIKINLNLFVSLSKYLPENSDEINVSKKTTVAELIQNLGIPSELVKLIFVNGKMQNINYQLKDNDRVGLFPPVGGG